MSESEKKIMETCGALVPQLTELEKEKFLSFAEGMAFVSSQKAAACGREAQQPRA